MRKTWSTKGQTHVVRVTVEALNAAEVLRWNPGGRVGGGPRNTSSFLVLTEAREGVRMFPPALVPSGVARVAVLLRALSIAEMKDKDEGRRVMGR